MKTKTVSFRLPTKTYEAKQVEAKAMKVSLGELAKQKLLQEGK